MVIAQFENLKFGISSSTALLINNIKMSAECETEDQTDSSQQYVSAKNGKPLQITFTAIIDANLGGDVKENVVYLMNGAQRSLQGYFYIAGAKVFPFKMMLKKAETEEVKLSPSGKWVKTNVNITLKQSAKDWITGSPPSPAQPAPQAQTATQNVGGGGSTTPAKASVKTNNWVTTAATSNASVISAAAAWIESKTPTSTKTTTTSTAAKVHGAASALAKVTSAVSAAKAVTRTAKKAASTVSKTKDSVTKKVSSFASKIASARKK